MSHPSVEMEEEILRLLMYVAANSAALESFWEAALHLEDTLQGSFKYRESISMPLGEGNKKI